MKNKDIIKKMFLALTGTVIFLSLITTAIAIDHPVEPFQKAKAMALMEGSVIEVKGVGKLYILLIEGWGYISYKPGEERILLVKGYSEIAVVGFENGKYFVGRKTEKESKAERTYVDWSVAWDIAYKYLREIETQR